MTNLTTSPCIRCGEETNETFFCPCDLHHALCGPCGDETNRMDCAFIPHLAGLTIERAPAFDLAANERGTFTEDLSNYNNTGAI